jgi:hypothetical protein
MSKFNRRPGADRAAPEPAERLRKSGVLLSYGPGALVDLIDQAVMVAGLEHWRYEAGTAIDIEEPRLTERVRWRASQLGLPVERQIALREPPVCDDKDPKLNRGMVALRFPSWFVCKECRALVNPRGATDIVIDGDGRHTHECNRAKKGTCVPVRFVTMCGAGHVTDFDWTWFAHGETAKCAAPRLRLNEGQGGDLSDISIKCTACDAPEHRLSEASGIKLHCYGRRPWLGEDANEECDLPAKLQVRSATNAYFAVSMSALRLPEAKSITEMVTALAPQLVNVISLADLQALARLEPKLATALAGRNLDDVWAALQLHRNGETPTFPPIREGEWHELVAQPEEEPGDEGNPSQVFFARRSRRQALPPGVERVVLVHKLLETRVQLGFTRLLPFEMDLDGEISSVDDKTKVAPLSLNGKWLPASSHTGEGLLIMLDETRLAEWENSAVVKAREAELRAGYDLDRRSKQEFFGARFYMLHSLSHLLMSALALECGYASSSIRERLYCSKPDAATKMAGILLTTTTPGAGGTLGGLVEEGRGLHRHLRRAWELGQFCSSDPVCSAHDPGHDPSERFHEGASCHGCVYVSEPSCERFNRYLDRALVVPAMGHPTDLAFFAERP